MNDSQHHFKLWGGRAAKPVDPLVSKLNASFAFDARLYQEDIDSSMAWARVLAEVGVFTQEELEAVRRGLEAIRLEFFEGMFKSSPSDEDIHTAVERRLSEIIGPAAGKLHSGRSRNDQVATDFRLWVMRACNSLLSSITDLCQAMLESAETGRQVVLPGYTHMQHAQPITWAHWILSHFWPLIRDKERLSGVHDSAAVLPLGSGALAGTSFPIDRQAIAHELGFKAISQNSIDAVADRDFAVEFLFAIALLGVHLSRTSEMLIIFNSREFGFVALDDAYTTGSSLMPQKKNPDPLELTRGKTGRLIGHLTGLLATLKSLPSAYDKDLQEDKEPVFDAYDTASSLLPVLSGLIRTLTLNPERMATQLEPALLATDIADELVRRGVPFIEAHRWVSRAVREAEVRGIPLGSLKQEDLRMINEHFEMDLSQVLDIHSSLEKRATTGGTAQSALDQQILAARKALGQSSGEL
jgi:argininosuccinate lyase